MRVGRIPIAALITIGVWATLTTPSIAGDLCTVDRATSPRLGDATIGASAKLLEAASRAFLTFRALEMQSTDFETLRGATVTLLDEAIRGYQQARALSDEMARVDAFLKGRAFERLRAIFGITPGTLNERRWEIIVRTAQESKTPTLDLIGVCESGAATLKHTMSTLTPGTTAAQARRTLSNWFLILSHGTLVSDAFDASAQ